jgi:hypothetical protein
MVLEHGYMDFQQIIPRNGISEQMQFKTSLDYYFQLLTSKGDMLDLFKNSGLNAELFP